MANYTREILHMMDRMLIKVLTQDKNGYFPERLIHKLSLLDVLTLKTIGEQQLIKLSDVVKFLEVDRNLLDVSIKRLVAFRLIDKKSGQSDRREKVLALTENGTRLLQVLMQAQLEELAFILNDCTINEEKTILKFLSKIVQYHTDKYEVNAHNKP